MNGGDYRPADGGVPVARARRVKRRPRDQSALWLNFPEAMLRICPGYPTADGGEPWGLPARRRRSTCSPARRVKRRPRDQSAPWLNFPEAMLRICPGYPIADGGEWWGLPNRRRR
ncbi:hypothetical protein FML02_15655 [Klebsiella oxytoca]|nr:hypothetical protein [Klebsiella oxytoca]